MMMIIEPHPGSEASMTERRDMLLLEYACGALDEAASLMVASWLALSPEARRMVDTYESVGGAMMCQSCQPSPMEETSLRNVLGKLECAERAAALAARRRTALECNMHFPEPLQAYLDASPSWQDLCRGIEMFELPVGDSGSQNTHAVLLRSRPGAVMDHIRPGLFDMTLVLAGGFGDGTALYSRGDFMFAQSLPGRRYVADSIQGCLSFVISARTPKPASGLAALIRSFFKR